MRWKRGLAAMCAVALIMALYVQPVWATPYDGYDYAKFIGGTLVTGVLSAASAPAVAVVVAPVVVVAAIDYEERVQRYQPERVHKARADLHDLMVLSDQIGY